MNSAPVQIWVPGYARRAKWLILSRFAWSDGKRFVNGWESQVHGRARNRPMKLSVWCVPVAGHHRVLTLVMMEEREEGRSS